MGIKYQSAEDILIRAKEIVERLSWNHILFDDVAFLRSFGSTSRGTIARCHALGKAMQIGLGRKGFYLIEVISERFDKLSDDEQTKVIIHELMHIPKSFGGGFIHHDKVNEKTVRQIYEHYCSLKNRENFGGRWF